MIKILGSILQYRFPLFILLFLLLQVPLHGQFLETFDDEPTVEWRTTTGDGDAVSELNFYDGYAGFTVDATIDGRNIWWAIIQATVSDHLDPGQLTDPDYELRIEALVRSSHAPRRVNLHLHTQRTTDFHSHLMEFDIPDTTNWHTISMTTRDFDGRPGDTINAQLAMMDWGNEYYNLRIDYLRVDVVNREEAGPDSGEQVLYPPPVPEPNQFTYSIPVSEAAMIDRQFTDANLSSWRAGDTTVLTADGTKTVILRWNLEEYSEEYATDYGMIELTPHSALFAPDADLLEFDQIRLVEILNAETDWKRESVTWNSFSRGNPIESVLNTQMIIDIDIPIVMDESVRIHIPRPVIQRMIEGTTQGIAFYPLGSLNASFYRGENQDDSLRPRLYFNLNNRH